MSTTPDTPDHLPVHLPFMDGIRGIAAFWVFLVHTQILSGMHNIPFFSYGGLAVDLFMVMSGVLMTHHYLLRRDKEPWAHPRTWAIFWTRRFFRISPLYYLALAVALYYGPSLGDSRNAIAAIWPYTATDTARYTNQSAANILTHITYIFGVLPAYAFQTALPDWSIGLEMEFYAAFPFLMLLFSRFSAPITAIVISAACLAAELAFPGYFTSFAMSSFLPMKLYIFFCGMLIATSRQRRAMTRPMLVAIALTIPYLLRDPSIESAERTLMVLALFYLFDDGSLPSTPHLRRALQTTRAALSGKLARIMGNASYCVYLLHLLIVLPVAAWLAGNETYIHLTSPLRYGILVLSTAPPIFALAWLLHRAIEQPGIRAGKKAVRLLSERP